MSVGSVGGSVTAGQGAVHGGTFMAALHDWVRKVSPSAEHDLRNGAFGGSTSGLFAVCTNTAVQQVRAGGWGACAAELVSCKPTSVLHTRSLGWPPQRAQRTYYTSQWCHACKPCRARTWSLWSLR